MSDELLGLTRSELVDRFKGLTFVPQAVHGDWKSNSKDFTDQLIRIIVDVEDTDENRGFFVELKQVLIKRFEQLEIYIVSFPIDVL